MLRIREYLARLNLPASAGAIPEPSPLVTPECAPWCNGAGKRRVGGMVTEGVTDRIVPYLDLMRSIRYEYCVCPAGQRSRHLHDDAMNVLEARAEQREADRLWDASNLPPKLRRCSLASYLAQVPDATTDAVKRLRRWQEAMRTDGRWLLLHGPTGTCKTGHAASLLNEHLVDGQSGLYVVAPHLVMRLHAAVRPGTSREDASVSVLALLEPLFRVKLLVLDDLGSLDAEGNVELPSRFVRDHLFMIINERDLWDRPTIVTTNLDPDALETYLGERTFDRIRGRCDIDGAESFSLKVGGASRRGLSVVAPSTQAQA